MRNQKVGMREQKFGMGELRNQKKAIRVERRNEILESMNWECTVGRSRNERVESMNESVESRNERVQKVGMSKYRKQE